LSAKPTSSDSAPKFDAQLWADVGGTFTDCFIVEGARRRSIKVLSSGIVRGRLLKGSGTHLRLALSTHVPADFWVGASLHILLSGNSLLNRTVIGQPSESEFIIDRAVDPETTRLLEASGASEWLVELHPNLEAPVLAAHLLLGVPLSQPLAAIDIRLGTTRGTNALLTRTGARVGLVTTRGFGDCLEIGEQNRPDLFALTIRKPKPLTDDVIEVDERLAADGTILHALDVEALREPLVAWLRSGITSLAICLLHAHVNDVHEQMIAELAKQIGFQDISVSSHVAPMIKLVSRAETTVLDAYLTPILSDYVRRLAAQFNSHDPNSQRSRLRLMTSGGNLVDAEAFRGSDSILSGPAGGVVALARIADQDAIAGAIGLDMGGTSTDVSRYADGKIPRDYESRKAGVRVLVPMMAIHTVAAGGGSICDVVDGRMLVGPQSAGANPGPACYGRGGPLTVTDLNVMLGRLPAHRFPFPLDIDAAKRRLSEVNAKLGEAAFESIQATAEGFLKIAVTHMAEAVRTVSTAQGSDPRNFTLVGFGGAAGGHLCAVADAIGMRRIIDHRDASLLSALGMGLADVGRIRTRGVYQMLESTSEGQWTELCEAIREETLRELDHELQVEGRSEDEVICRIETDLRYQGTESTLILSASPYHSLADRFHEAHRVAFGFDQPERKIEVATIRCEATIASASKLDPEEQTATPESSASSITEAFVNGALRQVPLHLRDRIAAGTSIAGPAIVVDDNSTLVIEPNWNATKQRSGSFELVRESTAPRMSADEADQVDAVAIDAVTVEVVARRMQGIADSMGELLRRTAASVNIRQRLDFSCAIFTSEGTLIANAPHVPVHLGAMGHTVREIRRHFPTMSDGDVYVSNNPYAGGSHLPDVTVVTPVFCSSHDSIAEGVPDFYVASRAHHAEIGGKTPGSMPPDGRSLAEEGVVIDTFALRRNGIESYDELHRLLASGPYPSRDPETNLADIAAQRAAGVLGRNFLLQLINATGLSNVNACVETLFQHAAGLVSRWIQSLPEQPLSFHDSLDDGTKIAVTLRRNDDRLSIDFAGTSPVHPGCFNATPAIVTAATIYTLRCVVGGTLPMNDGITRPIDLVLPVGLLNPPRGTTPRESPAVVAGNVETSMRVVDCLLGALGIVAASQGTMNNVLIGDSTFGYYETIGGGAGASAEGPGASGLHTHMTNTRITDPEVYESRYPIRLWQFAIRKQSGGLGMNRGGDGLVRELEFLRPLSLSLITNRRGTHRPWGMAGGEAGQAGENILIRADYSVTQLPSAVSLSVERGDRLIIKTPGGGGWGMVVD
jgi:5-oxoprolinase (ATP-hydrolysing)